MTQPSDNAFLDKLIQDVSPAYAIFQTAGPEAARLVDVVVAERLRVGGNFARAGAMSPEALNLWGDTLASARPYRAALQVVLEEFPDWWEQASAEQRKAMQEYLPPVAPAAGELGSSGVRDLIGGGSAALRCATVYALTTPDAAPAIAGIVRRATGDDTERDRLLDALVDAFPVAKMEESRDAERFLPALEKAVAASGDAWAQAVRLGILLVQADPSSAYGTLKSLSAALARVGGGSSAKTEYLEQFISLVESLGNRAAGVCLDKLPGAADGRPVADRVAAATQAYGVEAGGKLLKELL